MGYFREFPRRSQYPVPPGIGKTMPGLFLTTVTHFEHFLGPRCQTGAGPDLGPNLVSFWPRFGPQFGPKLVPVWSHFGPSLVPVWSQLGPSLVPLPKSRPWDPSKIVDLAFATNCTNRELRKPSCDRLGEKKRFQTCKTKISSGCELRFAPFQIQTLGPF